MEFYITILIFLTIIFLYIHIMAQFKKSEDLEIYEMDYSTNQNLQETCSVKQPVLFNSVNISFDLRFKFSLECSPWRCDNASIKLLSCISKIGQTIGHGIRCTYSFIK
jgi:hypothetical protein